MAHVMNEKLADAIDLSHHLSDLARRRRASPLKVFQKYMPIVKPGAIQLAGGLPDPTYFPFASIGGETMTPDSYKVNSQSGGSLSWLWNWFGASKDKTEPITIPRFPAAPGDISLAETLQYGPATGVPVLQKFIEDFVRLAYPPAYNNWAVLMHVGNTDGWSRCVQTLCNPGELILTDEWTYASAVIQAEPYQVRPVPVAMDSEGMCAVALEKLLAEWDEGARGAKRPHVIYLVPIGQNPCGMTMGLQRKKEIYDICVKYDIIIVEDDPYYFLQEGVYTHHSERKSSSKPSVSTEDFLKSLAPSFVTIDYQGRVVRLDTFSKTVAPGSRMGYFTCNPVFAERFERQGETTCQRPCGFGLALVAQLLVKQWGMDAWVRWLHGLQCQYTTRRDTIVDALLDEFDTSFGYTDEGYFVKGLPLYSGFAHPSKAKKLGGGKQLGRIISFIPPSSGMFVWMTVHFGSLPPITDEDPDQPSDHAMRLWIRLAKAGVLIAPGDIFAATPEVPKPGEGYYRLAFSMGSPEALKKGAAIFAEEVHGYFEDALKA